MKVRKKRGRTGRREGENGAVRSKTENSDRDQSGGDWFLQEPLGFCSIHLDAD